MNSRLERDVIRPVNATQLYYRLKGCKTSLYLKKLNFILFLKKDFLIRGWINGFTCRSFVRSNSLMRTWRRFSISCWRSVSWCRDALSRSTCAFEKTISRLIHNSYCFKIDSKHSDYMANGAVWFYWSNGQFIIKILVSKVKIGPNFSCF